MSSHSIISPEIILMPMWRIVWASNKAALTTGYQTAKWHKRNPLKKKKKIILRILFSFFPITSVSKHHPMWCLSKDVGQVAYPNELCHRGSSGPSTVTWREGQNPAHSHSSRTLKSSATYPRGKELPPDNQVFTISSSGRLSQGRQPKRVNTASPVGQMTINTGDYWVHLQSRRSTPKVMDETTAWTRNTANSGPGGIMSGWRYTDVHKHVC